MPRSSTERGVLGTLLGGEHTAGEIPEKFDMARPSVSENLRALRESDMVEERQDGRHRYYRAIGEPIAELVAWLSPYERFWRGRLTALGRVPDHMDDEDAKEDER